MNKKNTIHPIVICHHHTYDVFYPVCMKMAVDGLGYAGSLLAPCC
jgi:hypothetical protein